MTYHALLDRLAQRLWDERHVVTVLLYKLTVTRLLLAADERRFVADSLREVDHAVELLRVAEQARETAVRDLADAWRLDPDALTLDALVRLVPAPYAHTFSEHPRRSAAWPPRSRERCRRNRRSHVAASPSCPSDSPC